MKRFVKTSSLIFLCGLLAVAAVAVPTKWDGSLIEWATMREAIGQQNFQARGRFAELASKPHFYGIGAVAELKGEATVIDSRITATEVSCCGHMMAVDKEGVEKLEGTYLLGAYVEQWMEESVKSETDQLGFEDKLRKASSKWESAPAFPFLLQGELLDVKVHVVNGACPMHARIHEIELPQESKPFEKSYPRLQGRVLGFFADNAVGVRTHPNTSIHAHIVFVDPESGEEVTGHLERFSVAAGAQLSLPR